MHAEQTAAVGRSNVGRTRRLFPKRSPFLRVSASPCKVTAEKTIGDERSTTRPIAVEESK